MDKSIDPTRVMIGQLSEGLWSHFSKTFEEVIGNNTDLIFSLGEILIKNGVFTIDREVSGKEPYIQVTLQQLQQCALVTEAVLSTKRFRGTSVNLWGEEVARRIRTTQLMSGPDDFKICLLLTDLDRERLVSQGFVVIESNRLGLPIKIKIEIEDDILKRNYL